MQTVSSTAQSAFVLVAHGSRYAASNDEVRDLVAELQPALLRQRYCHVGVGFLELAQPSIPEAIATALAALTTSAGADVGVGRHVDIFPYFLARGSHVTQDIPRLIAEAGKKFPTVTINLLSYVGKDAALRAVILEQVQGR